VKQFVSETQQKYDSQCGFTLATV